MYDIIRRRKLFFILSGIVIIPGMISLVLWGIKPAIDFTGGTLMEFQIVSFKKQNYKDEISKIADDQKLELASLQETGNSNFLLRFKPIDKNQSQKFYQEMESKFGEIKEIRFETVGPTIGKETTQNAFKSVLIASLVIIIYIAWAFREIPKSYSSVRFGVVAVVALIHDVLVTIGLFSIFGHFLKVEVDSLFITALLTIMGFSVHDTIVVFDRIRENLKKTSGVNFSEIVNKSVCQTLVRSLSTSLTVLFTLFALLLFGGGSIRWFIVALIVGITSGTYSSIFTASPLLVFWEERAKNKK